MGGLNTYTYKDKLIINKQHETLDIIALKLLAYIELAKREEFIIICSLSRAIKIEDSAIVDIFSTLDCYNDNGTLDINMNTIEPWVKDVIGWHHCDDKKPQNINSIRRPRKGSSFLFALLITQLLNM